MSSEPEIHMIGGKPHRYGFLYRLFVNTADRSWLLAAKRECFLFDESADVFHYTDIAGFQGIIESGGLWANDSRFLNDNEEITHGINLAKSVLDHCLKRTKNGAFRSVLSAVQEKLGLAAVSYFVLCFSQARDNLEQWRAYAPSDGICIGFRKNIPKRMPIFFYPNQVPHLVVYDDVKKIKMMLSILRNFRIQYEIDRRVMEEHWPDSHDQEYIDEMHSSLSLGIVACKNAAFKQEREIRIVIPYENIDRYGGKLRFRANKFGLVPYLSTADRKIEGDGLPIFEIIIGPSPRQSLIAQSVKTFLDHRGYKEIVISLSRIPFRS